MSGGWEAELREILAAHLRLYPRMEPVDAVKLIFQNELGGGHLLGDAAGSLSRLRQECAAVAPRPGAELFERIGGGRARLQLAAMAERGMAQEAVNELFVDSCNLRPGSRARLMEKLTLLADMAAEGALPIPTPELRAYLTLYRAQGCPMVSHSPAYRLAYAPAYRVVSLDLAAERGLL